MKTVAFSGIFAVVAACVPIATEQNVGQMPLDELCTSAIVARNLGNAAGVSLASAEIERRGGFNAAELRLIRANAVAPGMSERAAVCAWGRAFDAVNTTATASGLSKQYVYRGQYTKTRYFYTRNGRVTAVQN